MAAEFATRVALAAKSDQSGSPNSPSLQQPSSRASNYSENESQASPDMQGMYTSNKNFDLHKLNFPHLFILNLPSLMSHIKTFILQLAP